MKESIIELLSLYNKNKHTQRKYNQFGRSAEIIRDAFVISFDSEYIFGKEKSVIMHFAFIKDTTHMFITHPKIIDMVRERSMSNIDELFDAREQLALVVELPGFVEVINCKSEEDAFQQSLLHPGSTVMLANNTDFTEIINYFWDM